MKEQESEKKLQKKNKAFTHNHSLQSVEYNHYTVQKPPSVHTSLIKQYLLDTQATLKFA